LYYREGVVFIEIIDDDAPEFRFCSRQRCEKGVEVPFDVLPLIIDRYYNINFQITRSSRYKNV